MFPEQTFVRILSSGTTVVEGSSNFTNSFSVEFSSLSSFSEGHWLAASLDSHKEGVEHLHGYILWRDQCQVMQRKREKG